MRNFTSAPFHICTFTQLQIFTLILMSDKHKFLVTTTDKRQVDLTKGKELRSNNLFPFGRHNYAIYLSPEGLYIKGTNSGIESHMLDTYEVIAEADALDYRHPFRRLE